MNTRFRSGVMDSNRARELYAQNASAMAYIEIEDKNHEKGIGSAFHVGDGVFVTSRHVVENKKITEVKITEPVAISRREYFRNVFQLDVTDEFIRQRDEESTWHSNFVEAFRAIRGQGGTIFWGFADFGRSRIPSSQNSSRGCHSETGRTLG
jgi:hypothetical protein